MKKETYDNHTLKRERIAHALIHLLHEKELSAISITELTEAAGVSRMTFYRNFDSKEEVISSYCHAILQQYDEEEIEAASRGTYSDIVHMIHYFSFLIEHQDFLEIITTCACGDLFSEAMANYIINKWQADKDNQMEYYKLIAFAGSLYRLYIEWAKNNFEETPEEMALIFSSQQPKESSRLAQL